MLLACTPTTWEVEAGGTEIQDHPQLLIVQNQFVLDSISKTKLKYDSCIRSSKIRSVNTLPCNGENLIGPHSSLRIHTQLMVIGDILFNLSLKNYPFKKRG